MAQARYQYGTSPRKTYPNYDKDKKRTNLKVVEEQSKNQAKISAEQRNRQFKMTVTVIGIIALLLTISCRNSQIDKKFNEIQKQKKELSTIQKENEQLKVKIENSLNLNNIEKIAKEELGMQKLSASQTVYVTLPKKDYVEAASEKVITEESESWFDKIIDKILNF